jgi:hypothetical protein
MNNNTGIVLTVSIMAIVFAVIVWRANIYYIEQTKQDANIAKLCIESGNEWRRTSSPPFIMECVKTK